MDAALRIFLVISGDSGPRVEFFWPPLNEKTDNIIINVTGDEKWSFNTIEEYFNIYGIPLSHLGEILFPPHRYHHKIFELKIDNILFISYPFCWPKKQLRKPKKLDGFNVVFTINLNHKLFTKYDNLNNQNKYKMWKDIIIKYIRIVQHEERRIGYLSSQLMKMSEITNDLLSKIKKEDVEDNKNQKKRIKKIIKINTNIIRDILNEMCLQCPIANDIKRIQQILSKKDEIKLLINGWVELHCSLKPLLDKNMMIRLRPYHTLLLLPTSSSSNKYDQHNLRCIRKDAYDLLQEIPISGSQSLRLMISTANICSSFGDMASLTNIPLPTLFHFSLHLKYWGKAKIIETINKSSQFVINPNINFLLINKQSLYQKEFHKAFPHRKSLIKQIQIFNYAKNLSQMLIEDGMSIDDEMFIDDNCKYDQKQDFIFLIAWMLQRNLLVRVYKYYNYIDIDNDNNYNNNNNNNNNDENNKSKILFDKIKPFLNGENHLLEIAEKTGLSSKKLQLVIDQFKDQLILCQRPKEH